MTKQPFNNETSQVERRATLENDRRDRIEAICRQAIVEIVVNEIIEEEKCQSDDGLDRQSR